MLAWIAAGVLALPRSHVGIVEQADALQPAKAGERETAWFTRPSDPWPAYSLDENLELRRRLDSERFTAFFDAGGRGLGLNCQRLQLLPESVEMKQFPLAPCQRDEGPVSGLGLMEDDGLVLISSGPALVEHLSRLNPERGL